MKPVNNLTILYIDDDADDLLLLEEALRTLSPACTMVGAPDGEKGLHVLEQLKGEETLPCLIVLDVNMPGLGGRETLARIQNDPVLAGIPLVVFSTSTNPADKTFFAGKGVAYITKPLYYEHLVETVRRLLSYCQNAA